MLLLGGAVSSSNPRVSTFPSARCSSAASTEAALPALAGSPVLVGEAGRPDFRWRARMRRSPIARAQPVDSCERLPTSRFNITRRVRPSDAWPCDATAAELPEDLRRIAAAPSDRRPLLLSQQQVHVVRVFRDPASPRISSRFTAWAVGRSHQCAALQRTPRAAVPGASSSPPCLQRVFGSSSSCRVRVMWCAYRSRSSRATAEPATRSTLAI